MALIQTFLHVSVSTLAAEIGNQKYLRRTSHTCRLLERLLQVPEQLVSLQ